MHIAHTAPFLLLLYSCTLGILTHKGTLCVLLSKLKSPGASRLTCAISTMSALQSHKQMCKSSRYADILLIEPWCYILPVIQSREWISFLQVLCPMQVAIPDSISMFNHTKDKVILKCMHKAGVRVPEQTIFEIEWVTFKIFWLNPKFLILLMECGINK